MDSERAERRASPLLVFFGLETREKALEVAGWTLPYLGILCAGFAGLSYLVHLLIKLPLWVYVVASTLGVLYFFFFLARVRQMGEEAHARSLAAEEEQKKAP